MFLDDILQNTKPRANAVNRPPLGALVVWYRWCDDGFGHGKKLFMEIVEGAIVEGLSGGVQCL